jgi:hypothetical protein
VLPDGVILDRLQAVKDLARIAASAGRHAV